MILGLHIEVLFANFGFLANPQPKVMNAFFPRYFCFLVYIIFFCALLGFCLVNLPFGFLM